MTGKGRALKTINLEFTDRIPHWEFLSNPEFEKMITGIDPYLHPQKARLRVHELLDIDVGIPPETDEGSKVIFKNDEDVVINENGKKVVKWGSSHTWNWDHGMLFKTIDDVLKFDPISFFLDGEQKIIFDDIKHFQKWLSLPLEEFAQKLNDYQNKMQNIMGDRALVPAYYYRTLLMWPLMLFGWELFSELAYCYKEEFRRIWRGFLQISKKVMKAFSMTGIKLIMSHDDICITNGPIFNPKWYRENLYPYYEEIWEPLKKANIKILFLCDGKLDDVVDDVISAGADGIFAEPYTNLELIVQKYKDKLFFAGNIDTRILLRGDKSDIKKEVERCTKMGKSCPGYFYSVSNHLTWNLLAENVKYYFDCCKKMGKRA